MKTLISIIAAIGKNRELGKDNKLLWHIPEDMKRFKKLTQNHAVIMGRKTYESIGKPLPNRINIVVTRDIKNFQFSIFNFQSNPKSKFSNNKKWKKINEQLYVCNSLESAIQLAEKLPPTPYTLHPISDEVFVIGGGQIYNQAIKIADKLYLTIVDATADADTFFPDYSIFKKTVSEETKAADGYRYTFLVLTKE